jgi:hypothetical protein
MTTTIRATNTTNTHQNKPQKPKNKTEHNARYLLQNTEPDTVTHPTYPTLLTLLTLESKNQQYP